MRFQKKVRFLNVTTLLVNLIASHQYPAFILIKKLYLPIIPTSGVAICLVSASEG